MNFSTFQQQQQQQVQQQQHDHDPSQMQAYYQSSQPYYYAYDNNNNHQYQFQQEPTSVHPPGVPITPEPVHSDGPSQTQQVNPVQGVSVAGSLYPAAAVAAVAGALAQLSNYVGNVDGMQTAMYEQIGPSQYRGRGRRGGRPFRGGGRGHFNHRGRAPYGGRGRGRAGHGRHFPYYSSGPAISNGAEADAPAAAAEGTSVVQPSSLVSGQIPLLNPTQVPAAPFQPQLPKLWCEICKVECNSPEILEQHMNGKRHKKNLLVHEELQRRKAINGQQSGQTSTSQLNLTIQPEQVQESEKKGCPTENMDPEPKLDDLKNETELQNNVGETSEVPAEEPEGEASYNYIVRGRGFKRKMRGGRGSKYTRTYDGSRKPVEPKQAMSFICELCNVKCDTQLVYNSHLTGKKHLSSLKRVHGHQDLNGEAGLQPPLHPPGVNDMSNSTNSQVQQGVTVPQGVNNSQVLLVQLLRTVLSQIQVPATAQPSGPVAAQIQPAVTGSSHEHLQNLSQTQVSGYTGAHIDGENPTGETKGQLLSAPSEADTAAEGSSMNTQTADGRSATEEKMLKLPQDSSVMKPADNQVAANNHVPS